MRELRACAAIAALVALAACARPHLPASAAPSERDIALNGHLLRLHFANPHPRDGLPLIVFATGDGGWHRKDLDAWKHLVAWGYPAVGFDARDYVTHLGRSADDTTTPRRLGADYARIIAVARATLNLAEGRAVVLVGISRGAGLAVVAAGVPSIARHIDGVLAVALTREEEYVKWFRRRRARDRAQTAEMVQLYEYLPQLGEMPIAVVQSTHDDYLPASEARELFGPDTGYRRFQAVDARNHSFAGARDDLYRAMSGSLDWIDGLLPAR